MTTYILDADSLQQGSTAPVTGLTPYVNLHYTGRRAVNDTNTFWTSDYTTLDLGARYTTRIMGVETTWRLTVNNLTNEEY